MIEIEIDGQLINAESGEMLIAVTDREGISVPRFCYHKKLSVAANCRMCLVDVEGVPKPQPACSTPIAQGMKVHTQNAKAKASQKAVMEFLLINHPLDCPICDQGGECELQDVAMEYGTDVSKFSEGKRILAKSDIGALIQTDMTRCIHCTRCVRFGTEIAGIMEMGSTGRGEDLKIEPFLTEGIESELSGNMIDVCPVGALTSKPFRYELRSWQMRSVAGVARHDLVASNLHVQTYKGKVKRIVARENDALNETWISDRDRFSYEGLTHSARLLEPQIKVEGKWQVVSWSVALDFAVKGLHARIISNHRGDQLGAFASNTATLEEFYLLQKLLAGLGSENMDYRLDVKHLAHSVNLPSNITLLELEQADHILLIGSNLRLEQPMINHRVRKATLNGANVAVLNVMTFDFNYDLEAELIRSPHQISLILAGVLKAILSIQKADIPAYLADVVQSAESVQLAEEILRAKHSVIIVGAHIAGSDEAQNIADLVTNIADCASSATLNVSVNSNAMAAEIAGFKPSKEGLDANAMLSADLKAYLLLDVYPRYDFARGDDLMDALAKDEVFVIALNSFEDADVVRCADVMLPMASMYETSGTQVNIEGEWQTYSAAVSAPKNAKPGWKVLKVLADLLQLPHFEYVDSAQIVSDIAQYSPPLSVLQETIELSAEQNEMSVIWQKSPYATDALSRHADSLQRTKIGQLNSAWMGAKIAKQLQLSQGDLYLGAPVVISNSVADDCVFVYSNQPKSLQERA